MGYTPLLVGGLTLWKPCENIQWPLFDAPMVCFSMTELSKSLGYKRIPSCIPTRVEYKGEWKEICHMYISTITLSFLEQRSQTYILAAATHGVGILLLATTHRTSLDLSQKQLVIWRWPTYIFPWKHDCLSGIIISGTACALKRACPLMSLLPTRSN